MFDAYCAHHGCRVLLTTRHILSLDHGAGGIVVRFRCWCGAVGSTVFGEPLRQAS